MFPNRVAYTYHLYLHFIPQQELVSQMGPYREQSSKEMGPSTGKRLGGKGKGCSMGAWHLWAALGRALVPCRRVTGTGAQEERWSPCPQFSLRVSLWAVVAAAQSRAVTSAPYVQRWQHTYPPLGSLLPAVKEWCLLEIISISLLKFSFNNSKIGGLRIINC